MVSARTNIIAAALAVSTFVAHVNAHGYMLIPETQFSGTTTSAWVVQIDPPSGFESDDWDGNEEASVTVWKELASKNGVTDLKTLLDGDTSLYGAECGYSDPNGEAQPIPSTSTATFSRAIQHVGPCEIWLDSTKVFSDDNCYGTYESDGTTVFPVDYSQCDNGGCSEMRFYWLAFQGVDGETVWQTYKDCIPLEGGSSTSTSTTSTSSETESEADTSETTDAPSASSSKGDDDSETTETTDAPSAASSKGDDDDDDDDSDKSKSSDSDSDSESTPEPTTASSSSATSASSTSSNSTSSTSTSTSTTSTSSSSSVPDGTWPTSQGTVQYSEVYVVAAGETFDGGMKTYERSDITCEGQEESGTSTAVFSLEAGATLKNVIIGANQMEGVHCDDHDCTIENVWWDDVCEDALSIKGGSASSVSTVTGGGARNADDKVVQHNGYGTVKIDGFYADTFGKLYRSCGTCGDRQRFVYVSNVYAVNPSVSIVTVNDNYGDEAVLSNIYIKADDDSYDVCAWSQGSEDGEPEELGAGIKDPLCQYSESDIHVVS